MKHTFEVVYADCFLMKGLSLNDTYLTKIHVLDHQTHPHIQTIYGKIQKLRLLCVEKPTNYIKQIVTLSTKEKKRHVFFF